MTTLQEALAGLPDDATDLLTRLSERIAGEYRGYVEPEDLYSEFMVWLAERPARADRWHYSDEDGEDHFGWRSFRGDASRVMLAHARREKIRSRGLEEDDALEYGLGQIRELLPFVWREPVLVSDKSDHVMTSTPSDPRKQPDRMISVFDVRAAYAKVIKPGSTWDRTLIAIYRVGALGVEIAEAEGVSESLVSRRHRAALEAIHREVNGYPEIRLDGPGSRKSVSNRTAIAATHDEKEDE